MFKTRTRKILGDVFARKGRTALVSISIMIGVFGVATLVGLSDLIVKQLSADLKPEEIAMTHVYLQSAGAQIGLEENQAYLRAMAALPGIERIEGQAIYPVVWRAAGSDGAFRDGNMLAFTEPFGEVRLEPIARVMEGRYPQPGQNEIAIERRFSNKYGLTVGDSITFRSISGAQDVEWQIVGVVFHPYFTISPFVGDDIPAENSIFANYEDAQSIVGFPGLSSMYVRYTDVALARAGLDEFMRTLTLVTPYTPVFQYIDDPDDAFILGQVTQAIGVLNMLAVVAMAVSGFLVTNVVNTIIVEQKRQIGVMKSLGATRWDTFFIYAGMALIYGVIGTIFGVLLSIPAAGAMAIELSPLALTLIEDYRVSTVGVGVGVAMGLLVPILAAAIPVLNGARVSILDAMTDLGIASDWGKTRLARFIGRLPVPITVRQALSNVAQKKGRLALTGITLTLAAAAFMGVTAVFTSLGNTITNLFDTFNYEVLIQPQTAQDFNQVRDLILTNVDGVIDVYPGFGASVALEGYASSQPINAGSNQLFASGIDPASPVIRFDLEQGTGWQEDPTRRGVILTRSLAANMGKTLGDQVVVTVGGSRHLFEVIGIDRFPFDNVFFNWRELAAISGFTTPDGDPLPGSFYLSMDNADPTFDEVDAMIDQLSEVLRANGIQAVYTNQPRSADAEAQSFNIFSLIFNMTSAVMAAVGAIGLLATLSMSVFERQKEIGVMRSIGAGSPTIVAQFLVEGVLVGVISWIFAVPLSYLLALGLASQLGFGTDFDFQYPPQVLLLGFAGMVIVATIASTWPSLAAARRTVSDILRYQ